MRASRRRCTWASTPLVTLLEARAKRDEARAQLSDGRDPAIVRRLRIEANVQSARTTFELVAREWHGISKTQWAAIHADDVLRSLERDVFPKIGELPIAEMTPPLIMEVLQAVEARGAIETAKRLTAEPVQPGNVGMARPTPLPLLVGANAMTCSGPSWRR